jgi:hypothetical protein
MVRLTLTALIKLSINNVEKSNKNQSRAQQSEIYLAARFSNSGYDFFGLLSEQPWKPLVKLESC